MPERASRITCAPTSRRALRTFPFRDFEHNKVWLPLVLLAHDLIAWTQTLLLGGGSARCEPKRLRYRLLHTAARLAISGRQAPLRLAATGPGPASSWPRSAACGRCLRSAEPRPRNPIATASLAPVAPRRLPKNTAATIDNGSRRASPAARGAPAPARPPAMLSSGRTTTQPTHQRGLHARSGLVIMRGPLGPRGLARCGTDPTPPAPQGRILGWVDPASGHLFVGRATHDLRAY